MAMVACDDFDLPNPPGQSYPEPEGYFENSGIVLAEVTEPLNLVEANEANKFVTVATIEQLVDFPENYTLSIDMQVAADNNFSNVATVATVIDDKNVTVNPDLLNGAIQSVKTKAPGTYEMPVRFVAYAELGTTRMRLGGIDATYCTETLKVTTLNADKVIEDAYYIVPCDANGKPQMNKAMKMNNTSGEGISGYDNPEFGLKFEVPADANYTFMIAPLSAVATGDAAADTLFGCLPAEDKMSGKLGVGYAPGPVTIFGDVFVTINMELDSYTVSYAFEMLYPFSGNVKVENMMKLHTDNYINYTGVAAINQLLTLAAQPDKNGDVIFKQSDAEEPVIDENGFLQTGLMTTGEGSTIRAPYKGNSLYWCDINLVQLTYSLYAIRSLSVIGDGNGWDVATATELTPSKDFRTSTATDVQIGSEFKINANGAWDVDFGGQVVNDATGNKVYNVYYKGSNLPCEAGKYDVTLDFSNVPYTVTLVKK